MLKNLSLICMLLKCPDRFQLVRIDFKLSRLELAGQLLDLMDSFKISGLLFNCPDFQTARKASKQKLSIIITLLGIDD